MSSTTTTCFLCIEDATLKACEHCECYTHPQCWEKYIHNTEHSEYLIACPSCRRKIPIHNISYEELENTFKTTINDQAQYITHLEHENCLFYHKTTYLHDINNFFEFCLNESDKKNKALILQNKNLNNMLRRLYKTQIELNKENQLLYGLLRRRSTDLLKLVQKLNKSADLCLKIE